MTAIAKTLYIIVAVQIEAVEKPPVFCLMSSPKAVVGDPLSSDVDSRQRHSGMTKTLFQQIQIIRHTGGSRYPDRCS
ncbi:MAG: hypothetical protein A2293_05500 [Elusimicrobia bacterium RIFOXYB2_FULL_49_7]|nr:MAG: hypothetical protein A2293_05500 [Elusimicrobia bacterium RIFOXYB2_FULL_49_7]